MRIKNFLCIVALILIIDVYGQKQSIELTFTAIENDAYVQLDSIKVMNQTRGVDTVLFWPDTVLSVYFLGIDEPNQQVTGFKVFQNYPNPMTDQTTISLYIPENDKVSLIITDLLGRIIIRKDQVLKQGYHSFRFTPGIGNLFFLTARYRGNSNTIKIIQSISSTSLKCSIEYVGNEVFSPQLKVAEDIQNFSFSLGDSLIYIGYTDSYESGIIDAPQESDTITLQFATKIPCPGTPTVTYEGQVYNTIQIFSQCWLKENLNVGIMISGVQDMTDNGIVEKYCYNNNPDSCTKFGGLYMWEEMMNYTNQEGLQGICPTGWHIPTDEEWKILEGAVDSQYGIGDPEWGNFYEMRGYDVGVNLKSIDSWEYCSDESLDLFGFSALSGGDRYNIYGLSFSEIEKDGFWWTSTKRNNEEVFYYQLRFCEPQEFRNSFKYDEFGWSVRCLKNN